MAGKKWKSTYAKQGVQTDVYTLALERVERLYSLFDTIVVMFSGGKDSTAVLNTVTTVAARLGKLPVKVVFWDEEAISYEVEDYVRRTAARPDIDLTWYCVPIKHRNACSKESPYWTTWNPAEADLWVRPMPPEAARGIDGYDWRAEVQSIPALSSLVLNDPNLGRVCQVMGIRAQESLTRTRAVTRRTFDNYIVEVAVGASWGQVQVKPLTPQYKAYPIYDWKTEDVWAAPARFGWDYCEAYDLMEMAGIAPYNQRLAPPFGEQPFRSLWMWKECFPAVWDKMCGRVPGAAAAALYSTTELYQAGRREKPPHLTWEQFIQQLIESHGPDIRPLVVKRVRDEINRHFRATTDPITPYVPHPDTGLRWTFLAKIAEIGDTKKRNDPLFGATALYLQCDGDHERIWAKWRADYDKMVQGLDEAPDDMPLPDLSEAEDTNL